MKWGLIGSLFGMSRGREEPERRYGREHRPDGEMVEFPMKPSSACETYHLRELVVELRDRLSLRAKVIAELENDIRLSEAECEELATQNKNHWKSWGELVTALGALKNEVNCRREHGADGAEHLEYIEKRLQSIKERYDIPF